ncbi:hypothetical protein [Nocardia pneumoniae]|uniref:hypothetical protein n=1 Tax=Nocardia pneumoniae TaxID=228601 RepID=UPI0002D70AEB|nr:hypothetical protein [Nocardia pneumoniae]
MSRRLVGEGCEDAAVPGIDIRQARGIIGIHEHCVPACPRKRTATEYLCRQGIPMEDVTDGVD